eukprot:4711643-Prymnesium_polylepis.1
MPHSPKIRLRTGVRSQVEEEAKRVLSQAKEEINTAHQAANDAKVARAKAEAEKAAAEQAAEEATMEEQA